MGFLVPSIPKAAPPPAAPPVPVAPTDPASVQAQAAAQDRQRAAAALAQGRSSTILTGTPTTGRQLLGG